MIRAFGEGRQKAKSKTSEKLPSLISTLMEEEKVIKEKYEMFTLPENVSTEKNLAENVSSVKCEEMETAVEMEDVGNLETKDSVQVDEGVSKENSETETNSPQKDPVQVGEEVLKENSESPKKDSEMETKIQELRLLLLQAGDEGRIKNFDKFVLNQKNC